MPTIEATIRLPPALTASAEPQNAPITMRAIRPGGAVRAGVFGSLSLTNSTSASNVKIIKVAVWSMNASLFLQNATNRDARPSRQPPEL